jgi:NDP-sugar pyrophosphorylase family protein
MKAYIYKTGTDIPPFGDSVGKSRILNTSLRSIQEEIFVNYGLTVEEITELSSIRDKEFILVFDYVYFTQELFEQFFQNARSEGRSTACALRHSLFTEKTLPLQEFYRPDFSREFTTYDLYYVKEADFKPGLLVECDPLVISSDEYVYSFEFPEHFVGQSTIDIPITSKRLMHIQHWIHILWANHHAIFGKGASLRRKNLRNIVYLLTRIVRAHSINMWKIAGQMVQKGSRCTVHPSAIVEAVEMGNNVKIGANAIVRASVLGDGCIVNDNAHVEMSVLGRGCYVFKKTVLFGSVLYDESLAGHRLMQLCLLGDHVVTTGGGYVIDYNFKKEVKVLHKGKLVSTGSRYIGCCFGHHVRMGTGVWINSGREIPNGYLLTMPSSQILSKIPPGLPEGIPLVIEDGSLKVETPKPPKTTWEIH